MDKAVIIIGDVETNELDCDIYYFPEDITEWELAEEIAALAEFYVELVYPVYWPPHIRKDEVKAWINGR